MMRSYAKQKTRAVIVAGLMLVGVFLLAFTPTTEVHAEVAFSDIDGHWAEYQIENAVSKGIVKGYKNGTFGPNKKVSRAEFVCMLNRALGNLGEAQISFSDVDKADWYYADIAKAVNSAYATGFEDGTFLPNKTISRQEAAFMVTMIVPTEGESSNLKLFSDYTSISDWAYKAMSKIVSKEYLSGYKDGKLHPLDALTRAQAVTMINDIMNEENIVDTEPVIDDNNTKLSGKIYPNNVNIVKGLEEGSVSITDCVILGTLSVKGGGTSTISVTDSRVANLSVAKAGSPVRILAKGETSIENTTGTKEFILQTSNIDGGIYGAGFENLTLTSAAEPTLRGTFGNVFLNGSGASVNFESGDIEKLTVGPEAKTPEVTMDDDADIEVAVVNAAANFFGEGQIAKMYINAKGVAYETKPRSVIVGTGGDLPETGAADSGVTISPEKGDTDVYTNTGITITFSSKMTNPKGKALSASKVDDIVTLTEGSAGGTVIEFTATINKAATAFSIVPKTALSENTKYYITILAGTMMDEGKVLNTGLSSYFTTGETAETLKVEFYPANSQTSIPLTTKQLTIRFSEKITDADGGTLTVDENSYLKKEAITVLKAG
ncbi:MAG: S-layer homology domain-containing protein, partial [Eubacteriales bacterium]|nr:S-layer homology domain-containing protein [Eubacteriales bacterium]